MLRKIRNVLTKIPKPMENPTNPFLYSFLMGFRKFFKRVENE